MYDHRQIVAAHVPDLFGGGGYRLCDAWRQLHIVRRKNQIKGLTTSAWLWTCSIFGLLFGAGLYTVALILAAVYIVILQFFPALEKYLKQRSNHFELHLELRNKNDLQAFMTTLRELGMRIDDVEFNSAFINSGLSVYAIKLTIESKELKKYKTHDEIIEALRSIDYIHYIEEK